MVSKMDDDSSSSEDEISKNALKEAADNDFLKNAYFSGPSKSESTENTVKTSITKECNVKTANFKSLRKQKDVDDQFLNFGVTPSFQSFVAKKLDGIIERNIKLKKKSEDTDLAEENRQQEDSTVGIKLLHSSTNLLTAEDDVEEPIKYKKRKKQDEALIETQNASMCKEVAVDSEWVLSKAGTKGWTPKRKDLEFKYKKLKNGVLVEKQ